MIGNVSNQAFAIDRTATLEFAGSVDSNSPVTLTGPGQTIKLDQAANFHATVFQFNADFFDFTNLGANATATPSAFAGGVTTLTVADGTNSDTLTLDGDHSAASFFVTDDGHGHALVGTDHAPQANFDNFIVAAGGLQPGGLTIPDDLLLKNDTDADPSDLGLVSIINVDESQTLGRVQAQSGDVSYTPSAGFYRLPGSNRQRSVQLHDHRQCGAHLERTCLRQHGGWIADHRHAGARVIVGAPGATLTGMGGGDVFVFNLNSGNQTITDFHQGQDLVDVSAFGFNETQLQAMIDATTPGDHALSLAPNETVTVQGVDVHQLQANHDFILHHS